MERARNGAQNIWRVSSLRLQNSWSRSFVFMCPVFEISAWEASDTTPKEQTWRTLHLCISKYCHRDSFHSKKQLKDYSDLTKLMYSSHCDLDPSLLETWLDLRQWLTFLCYFQMSAIVVFFFCFVFFVDHFTVKKLATFRNEQPLSCKVIYFLVDFSYFTKYQ